jgi:hypothetical protein
VIPYLGCDGARRMLDPFVDGELPVSEQVVLEAHLRWCDTCRDRLEDIRLIGSALRTGAAASPATNDDATVVATMYDGVLARVGAEREQAFSVRCRAVFTDVRYLWPAFGATIALVVFAYAATAVNRTVRTEQPDSMAALISILAAPGSDENPLRLDAAMLAPPRTLDVGPALASIREDEAVFALAAVVTREGRVSNYELLRTDQGTSGHYEHSSAGARVLRDVVSRSRFEPAQTAGGAVAVNVVWLMARTTVRGSAKVEEPESPVSDEAQPPVVRPAHL